MRHATMLKLAIGAALLAAPMLAQTSAYIQVEVPFTFQVGEQTLPAGDYILKAEARSQMLLIRAAAGQTTITMTSPGAGYTGPEAAELRFHVYGKTRFLSAIWVPGTSGLALATSPAERELANNHKPYVLAVVRVRGR